MAEKRRGLGRGLGALIPTEPTRMEGSAHPTDVFFRERTATGGSVTPLPARPPAATDAEPSPGDRGGDNADRQIGHPNDDSHPTSTADVAPVPGATYAEIDIDAIAPNPRQPRTVFDEDELDELVHSIREIGVLQPIVVRPAQGPESAEEARYELVMGERRWRASRVAGAASIPAIVKRTDDDDMLRDALLENLHRSQLNPLEEAAAYQQLLDDFGCTHEELAARIGRSRPQITNIVRLLRLPPLVARRVAAGVLSAGHARALLGLPDAAAMERLAQRIVAEGLSVRTVEEIVALGGDEKQPKRRRRGGAAHRPELDDLAARLADRLDTRVSIAMGRSKGKMTVEFASVDDLDRILDAIAQTPPDDLRPGVATNAAAG